MSARRPRRADADALLVRRTAIRVGVWIAVAAAVLVVLVLIAAVLFVFKQIPVTDLLDPTRHSAAIDVGGVDVIEGVIALGAIAIVLAGTFALVATHRAVEPLVDALARQRRFVADASHELRTPLAILDTRLQVLERAMDGDDPNRGVVEDLRGDSRRLIGVVNDLLASIDPAAGTLAAPERVAPVIAGAVDSMRILAEARGVGVRADAVPEDLEAAIPADSLHRALVALIDNAVKHSPAGADVEVRAGAARGGVWIAVADHGGGIRGIDPARVFDRFARSSDAVDGGGSAPTGFGIGLSLVQDALGRFGGSVEVTETSERGTTFTMRLPAPRR
ncbi:sensor histidine kinase [Demequina soli]|uniref:sensor histidine kinase n=1 Tax=Demequina soli TaxID=1638987 RepID=UPI000785CA5A|nr:HAMP domain-containing sensor histidine kinase [Demequina soli]